uniref:BHD_3 domain-containing protein n=1 Tax=Panagrellus redivivus TaxID=6233 RepID=A0A7E4UMB1_PANRE
MMLTNTFWFNHGSAFSRPFQVIFSLSNGSTAKPTMKRRSTESNDPSSDTVPAKQPATSSNNVVRNADYYKIAVDEVLGEFDSGTFDQAIAELNDDEPADFMTDSSEEEEEAPSSSIAKPAPRVGIESNSQALKHVDLIEAEDYSHFRVRPILLPTKAIDYVSSDDDADFIPVHSHANMKVPTAETNRIAQEQAEGREQYRQTLLGDYYKRVANFINAVSQERPTKSSKPLMLIFNKSPTARELKNPGDYLNKVERKYFSIALKQSESQESFVKEVFRQLVRLGFICRLVFPNPAHLQMTLEIILISFRGRFEEPSLKAFYNRAISDGDVLPYDSLPKVVPPCWIEIWDASESTFVCFNPLTSSYDCPDEFRGSIRYHYKTVQFVLAVDMDGAVYDVSPFYIITYADLKLRKHPISNKVFRSFLLKADADAKPLPRPAQDRSIRVADILREMKFYKSLPKPNCIRYMSNHALYVLGDRCGATEVIHPDAKPQGVIRIKGVDMKYYYRCALTRVASDFNWLKRGYRVKPNQEPARISRKHPWYRSDQVELATSKLDEDGHIPLNEHSNVYAFRKWMIPEGCVFIKAKTEKLGFKALDMELQCPRAIVGFEFNKTKAFPTFGGFIMRKQDYIIFFSSIICEAYEARYEEPEAPKKKRQKKVRQVLPGYC